MSKETAQIVPVSARILSSICQLHSSLVTGGVMGILGEREAREFNEDYS